MQINRRAPDNSEFYISQNDFIKICKKLPLKCKKIINFADGMARATLQVQNI